MTPHELFDHDLRSCRRCASELGTFFVDPSRSEERIVPHPIVSGIRPKPVLLVGQAPGISEYTSGKPFQGQAGQKIRQIFADAGVHDFDSNVFSSAVVKCYAGRKFRKKDDRTSKCEDRAPTPKMIRNCLPFFERQIPLVNPKLIVTLGGTPLAAYLRASGKATSKSDLGAFVGRTEYWAGRQVIFLPHTSGGSRWLNDSGNQELFRQAKLLLREALLVHGVARA